LPKTSIKDYELNRKLEKPPYQGNDPPWLFPVPDLLQPIKDCLEGLWNLICGSIHAAIGAIVEEVRRFFHWIWGKIAGGLRWAIDNLWRFFETAIRAVEDFFKKYMPEEHKIIWSFVVEFPDPWRRLFQFFLYPVGFLGRDRPAWRVG